VIVSLHVATGAALGAAVRSRSLALLLGPPLHVAGDRVPHEDIPDRSFEIGSGLVALALLAARRGPRDPAVGRHGVGISVEGQLLLAGTVVGLLLGRRR
jgi:hypothetical protein